MQRTGRGQAVVDPALAWSNKLRVEVGGPGTLAHAGVVLPRLLADRLGLTTDLAEVVARSGFVPLRHRGRLLVDAACALTAGATALTDVEALTRQEELYGPGGAASDTTLLRGLDELADRLGGFGLPGRRLSRAMAKARARAWAAIVDRPAAPPRWRRTAGPAGGRGPVGRQGDPGRLGQGGRRAELQGLRLPPVDRVVQQRRGQPGGDVASGGSMPTTQPPGRASRTSSVSTSARCGAPISICTLSQPRSATKRRASSISAGSASRPTTRPPGPTYSTSSSRTP